jgi:uncharacterized protein
MILSRYHVVTQPCLDHQDGVAKRVVFATRTAQRRVVDVDTWDRIAQGDVGSLPPPVARDLADIELLVPADEDEAATILQRNQAAIENDDSLVVVVEPTALCQLACDYCGQHHERQSLAAENQERLIRRTRGLLEARFYRIIRVRWYGGEPLLGLDVIRALTPRFQALAEEFHCQYHSLITTNGLELSGEVAAELSQELGVKTFGITLDGTAETHDARRATQGGGRTFDRIFANIVSLVRREDLEAAVWIRCNVDRRNAHAVSPLIETLARERILYRLGDFYVAPVHNWGNDASRLALPKEEFAELETRWLAELIALGFTPPTLIPRRREINCMALTTHGVVVDPYGQLFSCTEASLVPAPPPTRTPGSKPANQQGSGYQLPILSTSATYALGQLRDGEQQGRRQLLGDFNARVARDEYACSTCRMLPVCGGSCPKQWLEGGVPCPSTKYNIEARLLLAYALHRLTADSLRNPESEAQ